MNLLAASVIPLVLSFATFAVGKASEYIQLIDKLNYELRLKSFKLNRQGLTISLDFWLDNPTDTSMKITYPLVVLHYNGEFLAQNSVTDTKYTLKPKSQLIIPNITFKFGLLTVAQLLITNIIDITDALVNNSFNQYVTKLKQSITYTASFEVNNKPLVYKATALGYVPLSAIDRPITPSPQYDHLFPLPNGNNEIVIDDANVFDTVRKMYEVVKQDNHLVKKATQKLFSNEKTVYKTSKKIFDFVFKHIKYNLERGEQLRNPAVTYHKGQRQARAFYQKYGYYHKEYSADCDDIAMLIASFLTILNIKFAFRITSYGYGEPFSHVYVIAFDEKGSPIIIDPVYHLFNAEKQFTKQITFDKNMEKLDGIPVSYLSGGTVSADDIIKIFLQNSRDLIAHRANNYQNAHLIIGMYDYVLRYWDTKNRIKALQIVSKREEELIKHITPRQHRNRCGGKMFFRELKDFASDNVSGLGAMNGVWDLKQKIKDAAKKVLDNLTNKNHVNNTQVPSSTTPETIATETPEEKDYTKESILKTGRDLLAKYKIPASIFVFMTASGIVIASSPKIQRQLKLRKSNNE